MSNYAQTFALYAAIGRVLRALLRKQEARWYVIQVRQLGNAELETGETIYPASSFSNGLIIPLRRAEVEF